MPSVGSSFTSTLSSDFIVFSDFAIVRACAQYDHMGRVPITMALTRRPASRGHFYLYAFGGGGKRGRYTVVSITPLRQVSPLLTYRRYQCLRFKGHP